MAALLTTNPAYANGERIATIKHRLELLSNVCKDVEIESAQMPLNSEDILSHAANTDENARLEKCCRKFWRALRKSFFHF